MSRGWRPWEAEEIRYVKRHYSPSVADDFGYWWEHVKKTPAQVRDMVEMLSWVPVWGREGR